MRKFLVMWIAILVAASLLWSGCKRETEAPETPSEATAQSAEKKTLAEAAEKAEEATKILAAAQQGVDPADAPAYLKKIAHHLKGMSKAMSENAGDCAQCLAALNKYLEDNQAEMNAMRDEAAKDQEKLSDVEKMKIAQQAAAILGPVMQEFGAAQASFARKCPNELKTIAGTLKALQEKPK